MHFIQLNGDYLINLDVVASIQRDELAKTINVYGSAGQLIARLWYNSEAAFVEEWNKIREIVCSNEVLENFSKSQSKDIDHTNRK